MFAVSGRGHMQKIIGSIIVIFACGAMGFEKGHGLQLHLKELETLKNIFVLLKKEMQYTRAPLSEIFLKISRKMEGNYGCWLNALAEALHDCQQGTFQELWSTSIDRGFQESKLSKEEKEELRQVGKSMGYVEAIELYLEQLDISIQKIREESKSKKKLYQSMGILCGVFLVIVLF